MTVEVQIEVTNKQGVHARPSSLIVRCASEFVATILIRNETNGVESNAKSPIELLMLNAPCGTHLTIIGDGNDAQAAVDAIVTLIKSGFNGD